MRLSLAFIAEKLKRRYSLSVQCPEKSLLYRTAWLVRSSDEQRAWAGETPLVVASCSNVSSAAVANCAGLVWLGPEEPPRDVPAIWIPEPDGELEVLDAVLDIMERHIRWYERVHQALLRRESIVDVVDMLPEVTSSPFWFADAALRVLRMEDDGRLASVSSIWRYQQEHGRYSAETLQALVSSGDLDRINAHEEAWLFIDNQTYEGPFISKAIVSGDNISGYLFTIPMNDSDALCDIELLEVLGNLIASYLQRGDVPSAGSRLVDQILKDCLEAPWVDEADLADLVRLLEWDADDPFAIAAFEIGPNQLESNDLMAAQTNLLEDNVPGRVIVCDDRPVLVCNLASLADAAFVRVLESLCRKLKWKAGLSNRFSDLRELRPCYLQALAALRIGTAADPSTLMHSFGSCFMSYLCEQLAERVSEPLLIHQDVRRVARHDQLENDSLLETLDAYLNNERSIAQTAQELYLHRNSVAYRIDKLRGILRTSLDDDANRLDVMLSLRLWKLLHA